MVKIYADGADLLQMIAIAPNVDGFTTNPSLCRKAGVESYQNFCRDAAKRFPDKPISFEVIADEFNDMERQARVLAAWGENVYVKIPITNTMGESSVPLIKRLSGSGIKVNVTAVFTGKQVMSAAAVLHGAPAILSIFAGRIADTGMNPQPLCRLARRFCTMNVEILWASTRELINIKQAEEAGCDIITVQNDLLAKRHLLGKDLTEYSLETVKMFYNDAQASGYVL